LILLISSHPPRGELPSFPTRRSSDLSRVQPSPQGDAAARLRPGRGIACRRGQRLRQAFARTRVQPNPFRRRRDRRTPRLRARGRDRKSTRLNSSHVEISYAVFCLKKKKNKTHTQSHPNHLHNNHVYQRSPDTTNTLNYISPTHTTLPSTTSFFTPALYT